VSSFRPAVRTASPDGRRWEIYAYKFKRPSAPAGRRLTRLLRICVELPAAVVRARTSDEWTNEAVSWAPYPVGHKWSTTSEFRGQVLAQVEGGIVHGETPRPRNAQRL
jgi:hypothetical protein